MLAMSPVAVAAADVDESLEPADVIVDVADVAALEIERLVDAAALEIDVAVARDARDTASKANVLAEGFAEDRDENVSFISRSLTGAIGSS